MCPGTGPPKEYPYCLYLNGAGPLFSMALGLRLRAHVLACSLSDRRKYDPLPLYRLLPLLVTNRIWPPLARPYSGM